MILYIAGSLTPDLYLAMADRAGANNFLFTFAHQGTRDCARYFAEQKRPDFRLLIDSGAFSAWTQDAPMDLDEYLEFSRELMAKCVCRIEFIGLDIIAGASAERKAGNFPAPEQIEDACRRGFENYLAMEAAGINCLPTFHRDDPWHWLDRIAKRAERFCLAPRADGSPKSVKMAWLDKCFKRLGRPAWERHRIHLLGISSQEIMETYPFYSVDSTVAVRQVATSGSYRYFDGYRAPMVRKHEWGCRVWEPQLAHDSMGDPSAIEAIHHYRTQGNASKDGQFGSYWFIEQAMRVDVQLESYLTDHWEHRGVVWDATTNR